MYRRDSSFRISDRLFLSTRGPAYSALHSREIIELDPLQIFQGVDRKYRRICYYDMHEHVENQLPKYSGHVRYCCVLSGCWFAAADRGSASMWLNWKTKNCSIYLVKNCTTNNKKQSSSPPTPSRLSTKECKKTPCITRSFLFALLGWDPLCTAWGRNGLPRYGMEDGNTTKKNRNFLRYTISYTGTTTNWKFK